MNKNGVGCFVCGGFFALRGEEAIFCWAGCGGAGVW